MKWFGGRKKSRQSQSRQADSTRQDHASSQNSSKRVISYYTASRRQLDNFERSGNQTIAPIGQHRFKIKELWFSIVSGVVIVIAIFYLATLQATPHITIQGQTYRTTQEYQQVITATFGNDLLNRFKPTLRVNNLETAVQHQIPEASQVTVRSNILGHRPEVIIITDTPLAVFSQPGSTDYILSNRGKLLLPSGATTFAVSQLPLLQNQTGVKGEAGQQFMRPDEARAFSRLLAQFKADTSQPTFTLALTPHEMLARESGRGLAYDERFLLNDDITLQYGSLRATQKKLGELGQTPNEYIDVRLVERAFYK